jgi:hypothetical protein
MFFLKGERSGSKHIQNNGKMICFYSLVIINIVIAISSPAVVKQMD